MATANGESGRKVAGAKRSRSIEGRDERSIPHQPEVVVGLASSQLCVHGGRIAALHIVASGRLADVRYAILSCRSKGNSRLRGWNRAGVQSPSPGMTPEDILRKRREQSSARAAAAGVPGAHDQTTTVANPISAAVSLCTRFGCCVLAHTAAKLFKAQAGSRSRKPFR
jgi:hypothetical protein